MFTDKLIVESKINCGYKCYIVYCLYVYNYIYVYSGYEIKCSEDMNDLRA